MPRADGDVESIYHFLFPIDPTWAVRWYHAFEAAAASLKYLPERFGYAPEASNTDRRVRQLVFGKRRNKYRILYAVQGKFVYILRVRHASQDLVNPDDI